MKGGSSTIMADLGGGGILLTLVVKAVVIPVFEERSG